MDYDPQDQMDRGHSYNQTPWLDDDPERHTELLMSGHKAVPIEGRRWVVALPVDKVESDDERERITFNEKEYVIVKEIEP